MEFILYPIMWLYYAVIFAVWCLIVYSIGHMMIMGVWNWLRD